VGPFIVIYNSFRYAIVYKTPYDESSPKLPSDINHNKAMIYNTSGFNMKTTYYPI
jgi:hypothetical protein